MKDHEIAQLVNELRDIAVQFHDHQSLRERIADVIVDPLKRIQEAAQEAQEPIAEHYRQAIATVCEGWTLPEGARKVLETALWSATQAQEADTTAPKCYSITIDKINFGDRWHATVRIYDSNAKEHYPRIMIRETPEAALAAMLEELGETDYANPKLMWTDQWDCKHEMSLECATKVLKEFYDEWPCGLEEIDACIDMWKKKANG